MPDTLTKQPAESRLYSMDFSPLLGQGETLSTVSSITADTPTGAAALTLASSAVSGVFASVRISGGTAGFRYLVTFVVTTSGGNTLESEGILQVRALA